MAIFLYLVIPGSRIPVATVTWYTTFFFPFRDPWRRAHVSVLYKDRRYTLESYPLKGPNSVR